MDPTYLGDGAYVEKLSHFELRLFTTNGMEVTNEIFLEIDSIQRLERFIEGWRMESKNEKLLYPGPVQK